MEQFASEGGGEPLAHELHREAEGNENGNFRSSLILAVAALETGVKEYVEDLVPSAAWLAFESPAPPLTKMLSDYLPTIASRRHDRIPKPPARIRRLVQDAVEARNAAAHRGRPSPWTFDQQRELLLAVKDCLYVMDYYRGRDWALEHVSTETLREYGLSRTP